MAINASIESYRSGKGGYYREKTMLTTFLLTGCLLLTGCGSGEPADFATGDGGTAEGQDGTEQKDGGEGTSVPSLLLFPVTSAVRDDLAGHLGLLPNRTRFPEILSGG